MKKVYPIVMTKDSEYIVVYVPDFDINTQGVDYTDAVFMAKDAIGLLGIDYEDDEKALPVPSDVEDIKTQFPNDTIALIDVDFTAYRRKFDNKCVRKNCTIPAWLAKMAEEEHINFSQSLQESLKLKLSIN